MKTIEEKGTGMKRLGVWCLVILGMMFFIPALTVYCGGFYDASLLQRVQSMGTLTDSEDSKEDEEELISALAKVISPDENIEVIKAHAVMLRTYRLRRKLGIVKEGALTYMTKEDMQNLWQKDYEKNYKIFEEAVSSTAGEVIYYKDELIEPIYHKESAGMTRDALALYKVDIPYLEPVVSEKDQIEETITLAKEEVALTLQKAYPNLAIHPSILEQQIQIIDKDKSQYIKSLQIGNTIMDGERFKNLFQLPSACFTIGHDKENIIFRVRGVGHGIGLSQHGASAMAKAGSNYKEILQYYYTGVEIKNF